MKNWEKFGEISRVMKEDIRLAIWVECIVCGIIR